jgi:hypothetical protein
MVSLNEITMAPKAVEGFWFIFKQTHAECKPWSAFRVLDGNSGE